MGQLSAPECPLCGAPNGGKWTCAPCARVVDVFRNLVRSISPWRSAYEAGEVPDVITDADGQQWSLWDVVRFYESREDLVLDERGERVPRLPRQMSTAIEVFLHDNEKESAAAVLMGNKPTSPVGMYATIGLTRLLRMTQAGEVPGLHFDLEALRASAPPRRAGGVEETEALVA